MRFEQSFFVQAPPDRVWAFLTDPRRAASALPGAAVTELIDDKSFAGTMTVKVGPVKTKYKGKGTFEKLDVSSYTAEMVGSAQDVKGRGGADMTMTSRLVARDGGTEVSIVSDVVVTGILAQFGRGLIQDVSDQLFKKFTERARAELEQEAAAAGSGPEAGAAGPPAAPNNPDATQALDAVSLGTAVAGNVLRRWASSPWFWVAILVAAGVIYVLVS